MWSDMLKTKNSHVNQPHQGTSHPIKKKSTDVIYPNVRVLRGLLLQVVLAVHGVVDHQTTWTKVRQVGYQIKALSGGQINWPKCARCVIYPLTNFLPVTTFWRFLTIFNNFQRVGGGLKRQNFQKIFLHPVILYITTVISTCIIVPALKKLCKPRPPTIGAMGKMCE